MTPSHDPALTQESEFSCQRERQAGSRKYKLPQSCTLTSEGGASSRGAWRNPGTSAWSGGGASLRREVGRGLGTENSV